MGNRLVRALLLAEALNLQARRQFRLRLLQHFLAIQRGHALVFLLRLARAQLFFTRVPGGGRSEERPDSSLHVQVQRPRFAVA